MSTPAELGLTTPTGDDLLRNGDNAITNNATKLAGLYDDLIARDIAGDWVRGKPTVTDLDAITAPGAYGLPAPFPAGWTGLPADVTTASVLVVHKGTRAASSWLMAQELFQYGATPARWWRSRRTSAAWNPWQRLGNTNAGAEFALDQFPAGHALRLQAFHDAYPLTSTAGKGVVCFRYDHGLTNFKAHLLPLHQARSIPAYIAMNSRLWTDPQNAGATQADARAWLASGLVQFGNHTADHQDKDTPADIFDTIVNGRRELEAQLNTTIHGFTVPGVTGLGGLGGFDGGTLDGYTHTYAGATALAAHGIVSGRGGSAYRPLDGITRQRSAHLTWEAQTYTTVKGWIDTAIATKTALTIMAHPRLLNTGTFTTALAAQVLDYVAAKIASGQLANLSYYHSHHATH